MISFLHICLTFRDIYENLLSMEEVYVLKMTSRTLVAISELTPFALCYFQGKVDGDEPYLEKLMYQCVFTMQGEERRRPFLHWFMSIAFPLSCRSSFLTRDRGDVPDADGHIFMRRLLRGLRSFQSRASSVLRDRLQWSSECGSLFMQIKYLSWYLRPSLTGYRIAEGTTEFLQLHWEDETCSYQFVDASIMRVPDHCFNIQMTRRFMEGQYVLLVKGL